MTSNTTFTPANTVEEIEANDAALVTSHNVLVFGEVLNNASLRDIQKRIRVLNKVEAEAKALAVRLDTAWKALPYMPLDLDPDRTINRIDTEVSTIKYTAEKFAFNVTCTIEYVGGEFANRLAEIDAS